LWYGGEMERLKKIERVKMVKKGKVWKMGKWGVWLVLAVSLALNGYWVVKEGRGLRWLRGERGEEIVKRVVRVIDGDTFDSSDGERVRLKGADAAEYGKGCLGEEAKIRLEELILGKEVGLKKVSKDHFGRLLGFVFEGDFFVDKAMVEEGLARASSGEDSEYGVEILTAQSQAKTAERGIWSEKCYPPKKGCLIKGNIRRTSGTKIYHLPGCFNYERIVINESEGDKWFCSEEEAEAAGFRKSEDCWEEERN